MFLQNIGADIVRAPEEGPWAPGYYSVSFRDPEGIRLELNHVPGKGLMADGTTVGIHIYMQAGSAAAAAAMPKALNGVPVRVSMARASASQPA